MNINITREELIACWGEEFFNECLKEAEQMRAQQRSWQNMTPAALVLAVAISKLKKHAEQNQLPRGK